MNAPGPETSTISNTVDRVLKQAAAELKEAREMAAYLENISITIGDSAKGYKEDARKEGAKLLACEEQVEKDGFRKHLRAVEAERDRLRVRVGVLDGEKWERLCEDVDRLEGKVDDMYRHEK